MILQVLPPFLERSRRGVRQCDELSFNGQHRPQNSRSFAKGVFFGGIVWIYKRMYVYIYIYTNHPFHSSHFSQVSRNQASPCFTLKKKQPPSAPTVRDDLQIQRSIGQSWQASDKQTLGGVGYGPFPVTVTTRIIPFLLGNPYKPLFVTVTGRWPYPREVYILIQLSKTSTNG